LIRPKDLQNDGAKGKGRGHGLTGEHTQTSDLQSRGVFVGGKHSVSHVAKNSREDWKRLDTQREKAKVIRTLRKGSAV